MNNDDTHITIREHSAVSRRKKRVEECEGNLLTSLSAAQVPTAGNSPPTAQPTDSSGPRQCP